jgi:hypothetical protein
MRTNRTRALTGLNYFVWETETLAGIYANIFVLLTTNMIVGRLRANNIEGNMFTDRIDGFHYNRRRISRRVL